jgi:hypothetical protein
MVGYCEHGNEVSGPKRRVGFIDQVSYYKLLKKKG